MGHDVDGPLRPVLNPPKPCYASFYTGREYKGRADWWSELGYRNSLDAAKKYRPVIYHIRESDPDWYDPKLPDGEGLVNQGFDSNYNPNVTKKADTPGSLEEFQRKVMLNSAQYKNIASKYNISPEHPGIPVSPGLETLHYIKPNELGLEGAIPLVTQYFTKGPRFFSKPMNEGCFEKSAALANRLDVIYSGMKLRAEREPLENFRLKHWGAMYLKTAPLPVILSATFGLTICASAVVRNKDDLYNGHVASAVTGLVYGTIKGQAYPGFALALGLGLGALFWHYQRCHRFGLQYGADNRMYGAVLMSKYIMEESEHRFPFSIVWTPIPVISWIFPFVGHMGIATARGVIRDFAGSYYVSEDYMAFGWPTCVLQLNPENVVGGAQAWDNAVNEASEEYKSHCHNLICDNCHSHTALALNLMKYNGKTNWNMVSLCFWVFFRGRRLGLSSWLKQFLPSLILIGLAVAFVQFL